MTMTYQHADDVLNDNLKTADCYLWLHTGNPTATGMEEVAELSSADIVRKEITFGNDAENHPTNDERRILNTTEVTWSGAEIDAGEAITHFSIWNHVTSGSGQPLHIAEITDGPKTTGSDGVTVSIGDIEVAISVFVKP